MMSRGLASSGVWIACSLLALIVWPGYALDVAGGRSVPAGGSRQLLPRATDPRHGAAAGGFYEFDPKMHFPDGDWITWPWGYDYLMAQAVRA